MNQRGSSQSHELGQLGPGDVLGVVEPVLSQTHQCHGICMCRCVWDEHVLGIVELTPREEGWNVA